jgi:hypothetical protein
MTPKDSLEFAFLFSPGTDISGTAFFRGASPAAASQAANLKEL